MSLEPSPSASSLRLVRPWPLLAGIVLALLALSYLGRHAADRDWHEQFSRFHPLIAPDSFYQPTVQELSAIVRARCRPDQVLVIVGGNSILLGVGQPEQRMWTRKLQELLGPDFVVINFAFRGSSPTDGGAVISEVLRDEYPKQIYVANAAPLQGVSPSGLDTYRFMTLDAYYKGLLLPWEPRTRMIADFPSTSLKPNEVAELKLGAKLDSWLYFHNFWTGWSYNRFFTFPTWMTPGVGTAFLPRKVFADQEIDFDSMPFETRFPPAAIAADTRITERATEIFYTRDGEIWKPVDGAHFGFKKSIEDAFPAPLKKRTLILVGRSSPLYTRKLSEEITRRDDQAFEDTVKGWKSAGYSSLQYGKNFEANDYGDRSHLTVSGGNKLAVIVAKQIKEMTVSLKYRMTTER